MMYVCELVVVMYMTCLFSALFFKRIPVWTHFTLPVIFVNLQIQKELKCCGYSDEVSIRKG